MTEAHASPDLPPITQDMRERWMLEIHRGGLLPDAQTGVDVELQLDWKAYASCADADPDLFFPIYGGGNYTATVRAAKAICNGCVVKEGCLEYGLKQNGDHAVYGGKTWRERRRIKIQRAFARQPQNPEV